jgi:hypothetical protein
MAPDVHFSKILIRPFIFQKLSQNKYKKSVRLAPAPTKLPDARVALPGHDG